MRPAVCLGGVLALVGGACLDARTDLCADQTCPVNSRCTVSGCVPEGRAAACDGKQDLEACEAEPFGDGVCRGGACSPAPCGDGALDPGEACDDGNRTDGDGCAGDCRSDETCGNRILDVREACDDGNLEPGDGCQADCALPVCGDGVRDPGEVCDDDNVVDGDGCAGRCDSDESCPNGVRDIGEACDDGNRDGGDGCQPGCVLPRCGDAFVDAGEVCDDGNLVAGDGCASTCGSDETCGNGVLDVWPDRDPAVDVIDIGEECDDENLIDHDGCQSNCRRQRCGDGIVDALGPDGVACAPGAGGCDDEACDDGNLIAGDGCTPDCGSDETCGNGYLDVVLGEACDDGNRVSGDGCGATCVGEVARWIAASQAPPALPIGMAAAYDAGRRRIVVFGGSDPAVSQPTLSGQTSEWNGSAWIATRPARAPEPRRYAAMAYDSLRGRTVLFGGENAIGRLRDTWAWDGAAWIELETLSRPPARHSASLAYDAGRDRLVLFGGVSNLGTFRDTWEFDGTAWAERIVPDSPASRSRAAMAYDALRGVIVLHGGYSGFGADSGTWIFDGTTWTPASPMNVPAARYAHAAAFDPTAGTVVIHGGIVSGGQASTETWAWDGVDWALRAIAPAGGARAEHALVFDIGRSELMLVGGRNAAAETPWRLVGSTWTAAPAAAEPAPRSHAAVAPEGPLGGVQFGGFNTDNGTLLGDTWRWREGGWTALAPASAPGPRYGHAMAWAPWRNEVVLFGGDRHAPLGLSDETWTWDGSAWSPWITAAAPSPRFGHGLAAEPGRDALLLFGGFDGEGLDHETWRLDDSGWTQEAPATTPTIVLGGLARADATSADLLAYGEPVESGGIDTWRWDGVDWREVPASEVPGAWPAVRVGAVLVYDPRLGGAILVGGARPIGAQFADTWWMRPGALGWQRVAVSSTPDPAVGAVAFSDDRGGQLVRAGGSGPVGAIGTSRFALVGDAAVEACDGATDRDRDGAVGCDDADCWPWCAPQCPPSEAPCAAGGPVCGDGELDLGEECRTCALDVGPCAAVCGDGRCDDPEAPATCPGDCP